MEKVYNVWVASNAYGGREDHCGFVRAFDEKEALEQARIHFKDCIRTSLKDKNAELDHLYVDEWVAVDDDDHPPQTAN
jgi:hypothetical protein